MRPVIHPLKFLIEDLNASLGPINLNLSHRKPSLLFQAIRPLFLKQT